MVRTTGHRNAKSAALVAAVVMMVTTGCTAVDAGTEAAMAAQPAGDAVIGSQAGVPTIQSAVEPSVAIDELIATMSIEQKVGQLLMPVLAGTAASEVSTSDGDLNQQIAGYDSPAEIVAQYSLGGVLYLEANVESAEQVRAMSEDLQAVAATDSLPGLLIAVDQEGGRVNRITDQVTVYPAAADFTGDVTDVTEAGYVTGQQVQRQGVNVVLAPVADVVLPDSPGFIGDRSFGSDPNVVAEMVTGSINGLQQSGVAAAVKHWPGHGATSTDSHLSLPEVDIDRQQWEQRERVPFDAAIANNVAVVVVGHLAVPGLDESGTPATFSDVIIDDMLRDEMGFDGVVMTDALNMGAVGEYDSGELAVDAIAAGADILLVPPDLAAAYAALIDAVDDERLTLDRLDQSVERILSLKHDLGLLDLEA